MISGKMNLVNKFLLLLCLTLSAPVQAADASITEVMQLFSQNEKSTVDFKEEKFTSFLDKPIVSSGNLEFTAPDKLAKFITHPEKISNIIVGDELVIKSSDKTITVDLTDHPEFSIILTSIINVLSGNHTALEKDFNITFKGKLNNWKMVLVPRDSFVHGYIDSILMQGNNNRLTQIRVNEANKDYSVTYISNHR